MVFDKRLFLMTCLFWLNGQGESEYVSGAFLDQDSTSPAELMSGAV